MTRTVSRALAALALVGAAACADTGTNPGELAPDVDASFVTTPTGFSSTVNTYAGSDSAWTPDGRHGGRGGRGGHHGGDPLGGGLMGGGLGGLFLGDGIGRHHGDRPFGESVPFGNCPFDAAAGRNVCPTETRDGLTIQRSAAFKDAAGNTQQAFDTLTTNSVNTRTAVSGTKTRRNGATSTVQHASDRTVTGLAQGSTQRTVNGTSAGTENTTGSDSTGSFTVVRVVGDTVTSVVIPEQTAGDARPFPTSGTVVRSMRVTVTYAGQSPTTSTRREVITYNGSNTATVVITKDGTTKTCTIPLPHGRPTCS